jgi:hypothetical protein
MGHYTSPDAFHGAVSAAGCTLPAGADAQARAHAQFDALLMRIACRLLDLMRLVSPQRTLQLEHLQNVMRISALVSSPVGAAQKKGGRMGGGGGGTQHGGSTVMTGSFFDANNQADAASYAAGAANGTQVFPAAWGGDMVRDALPASSIFPIMGGGAGSGGARRRWLADDAFGALLQTYRGRSGATAALRVAEAARSALRHVIEANAVAALRQLTRGASKSKVASADRVARTAAV